MKKVSSNIEKTRKNLMTEFNKILNDAEFKEYIDKLQMPYEELAKYTSILEECKQEYYKCKNCKSILECSNKLEGYSYIPSYEKVIKFCYKPCRYKNKLEDATKYLKNVYSFNIPSSIKEANIKDIYKSDINRIEVIKYLANFIDDYLKHKKTKGIFIYGNFGSGKTYLVSAIFNELAKHNIKSAIIFWPEYLRMLKACFGNNQEFDKNYELIKTIPLLLIDDLGAENTTAWGRDEILCPILQYRMENDLPTFITSNLNIEALENHFSISKEGVSDIKARRIIERINQLTTFKEMISKNLRK